MFIQELPPTRYDLRFSIAGIPVSVHPSFWLIALLFGASGNLLLLPIWVLVVFVSILVHELGHAFAFRRYGQRSRVLLYFAGGLTIPEPVYWGSGYANVGMTANQQIFISFAGPGAGFLFAALVIGLVIVTGGSVITDRLLGIPLPLSAVMPFGGLVVTALASMLLWVNIFWGLINLMPVHPLDGGSIARNIFVQVDPIDGVRKSNWLSVIAGAAIALVGLIFFRSIFIALLFALLAFQSYQALQHRY
jgi:membrane-associated protease RseP (regulator of RpoE activity)